MFYNGYDVMRRGKGPYSCTMTYLIPYGWALKLCLFVSLTCNVEMIIFHAHSFLYFHSLQSHLHHENILPCDLFEAKSMDPDPSSSYWTDQPHGVLSPSPNAFPIFGMHSLLALLELLFLTLLFHQCLPSNSLALVPCISILSPVSLHARLGHFCPFLCLDLLSPH